MLSQGLNFEKGAAAAGAAVGAGLGGRAGEGILVLWQITAAGAIAGRGTSEAVNKTVRRCSGRSRAG